jgi:mannose-6-phosphate isomerase-like protein (cupin superfamily)/uncharacterized membrane protein YphA (DoxX/SURF4 family)
VSASTLSTAAPHARAGAPFSWQRAGLVYARIALGAAFLSAVASRFGIWKGHPGLAYFPDFVRYTAEVNSFMPAASIPSLAWAATAAELACGAALVLGLWPRLTGIAAAVLLAAFGTAMAISFGLKSPLDYSVYSASAGALLLAFGSPPAGRKGAHRESPVAAATIVRVEDLPFVGMSHQFVGARHGVATSLFLLSAPPGRGPQLHRHEYDEVIVVLEGTGTVQIGDEQRSVGAGDIVAVPARTPHRFVNSGSTPLRQIDVHASPEFRQENLEPPTP